MTAPATRAEGGTAGAQTGGLGESPRCRRSSCGGVPWIEAPAPRVIAAKLRRVHVAGAAPGPPRASVARVYLQRGGPRGHVHRGEPRVCMGHSDPRIYPRHGELRLREPPALARRHTPPPSTPACQALLALNGAPGCPPAAPRTARWEGRVVSLASSTAQSP